MYKRLISIVCILSLLVCFMVVPAYGSSIGDDGVNDSGTQYLNYLTTDQYEVYDGQFWGFSDSPSFDYNGSQRFGFKFKPLNFTTGNYMLFAIRAYNKPDLVNVRFSYKDAYLPATYEGAIPSAGNLYFYRIAMPDSLPSVPEIEIFGRFDFEYDKNITLVSCFGVRNLLSVYDRAEFTYVTIERHTEGEFIEDTYKEGTEFFPYSAPSWLSSTDKLTRVDYTLRCDGDRFNTSAVGKVSLLMTTFCEKITATVSLVGKDKSVSDIKSIKCNIHTDSNWGLVNDYDFGLGTLYNYSAYQLDFDLTGYDMSNYDLQIFVSVDTVNFVSEGNLGTQLFDLTFRSMQYIPTVISNPWYKPITDSIRIMYGYLQNVVSSTEGLLIDLKNWWSELFTKWDNSWSALMSKLDELSGSDEELTNQSGAMKDQASQMQQANDTLNSVSKPVINADAMLDQYLNFNTSGLAILSIVSNNAFATSMLVVVFTFALCGYIFFGKKR